MFFQSYSLQLKQTKIILTSKVNNKYYYSKTPTSLSWLETHTYFCTTCSINFVIAVLSVVPKSNGILACGAQSHEMRTLSLLSTFVNEERTTQHR